MRLSHRLLAVVLCCAVLSWLAGPVGRFLVVLPLLLFGPGYLLERTLPIATLPTMALRPALWLGLSLSIVALLYEWTTALGLALTLPVLYALATSCGLGVIWRFLRESTTNDRRPMPDDRSITEQQTRRRGDMEIGPDQTSLSPPLPISSSARWWIVDRRSSVALLAIFALTLWTRFAQIKDLALPAWVDSVHHALMIRVVAEHGQAPYSLRPYLPIDQLPYHWGYHVFAAATMQLSGLPLQQTMLWLGQVLNALHILTVAALAAYLWRRPTAGIIAGLVVGLLSIMPAYYVSWGRYTQLTGLLLLPPLAIAWHTGLRRPSRGRFACVTVLLAGLSLIHFRVLVFALAFMLASGVVWAADAGWASLRARLQQAGISAMLALALVAPWLWVIAVRTLLPALARPQSLISGGSYNALTDGLLWAGHNRSLITLALAAALWGVLRRSRVAVEQIGWVGALATLANPWLIGYLLPATGAILALGGIQQRRLLIALLGGGLLLLNPVILQIPYLWLITNDVVVVSLFIPIGVLVSGGGCMLMEWLEERRTTPRGYPDERRTTDDQRPGPVRVVGRRSFVICRRTLVGYGGAALLGVLALWGAWDIQSVINPSTVLATEADVAAIAWAAEHTPADARFLINAAPWLNIHRGTDGGWWLLPLAGRWMSTPPVLYIYGPPDYTHATDEISKQVANFRAGQEQQLYQLIDRAEITYIYLESRSGPLSQASFADNNAFQKVYERDGVTILAVHR